MNDLYVVAVQEPEGWLALVHGPFTLRGARAFQTIAKERHPENKVTVKRLSVPSAENAFWLSTAKVAKP